LHLRGFEYGTIQYGRWCKTKNHSCILLLIDILASWISYANSVSKQPRTSILNDYCILYRNAHLWLQVLLNHFCLGGCRLINHDGCIYELKSFVDTLQVACAGLKMHHAWAISASIEDYLSRFAHMTHLWQVILTLPASTTSCERGLSTQNLIKSYGRCALNITILDALKRIAMAKVPMESLDFEDILERWMSVNDRRFQE
jgi:hypothetical protein